MPDWNLNTTSPEETRRLGRCLGRVIEQPVVVLLSGDLGAGKTCLTQGIARGLGVAEDEPIVSPSYTLMNLYQGRMELYHFDLYRLSDPDELEELGLEEYLPGAGVAVVEWANRFPALCDDFLGIEIRHQGPEKRAFAFHAEGAAGLAVLAALRAAWSREG
jgi:tRNA threonylcarbamoyladenosine biosynthesis protein TsaE